MSVLTRVSKVGEGTYGTVYKAKQPNADASSPEESKVVAVKRNFKDISASWIGNPRELDMLAQIKGHPFTVDLINVSFGNPFGRGHPMTPINEKMRQMKEDKIHFVMEFVGTAGDKFFGDKQRCTPLAGKIIACQLLLAMEFIQSRNIAHRDLKPANLLISNDPKEGLRLRICDFGMSQVLCKGSPSTPGVATSWYRAPEICCTCPNYTIASDNWSIGAILFEIFGRLPYLYAVGDNDTDAFNAILAKAPVRPDPEEIRRMLGKTSTLEISPTTVPDLKELHTRSRTQGLSTLPPRQFRRRSFLEQLEMSQQYQALFKQEPGSVEQLIEIITGFLQINPDKRWTPTQALEHPFFDYLRDYIKGVRQAYPPIPPALPCVKITQCIERKWAIAVAFTLYNERHRFDWYRHRLIFHAIDLFDRYLEWAFTPDNTAVSLGALETTHTGRLHSRDDAQLRFWVCLYLIHKYYATMSYPLTWSAFVPKVYVGGEKERIAEQFEVLLVKDVVRYRLYRDTLFEIADQYADKFPLNDNLVRELLLAYGQMPEWDDGSVRALFRKIMKINPT